MPDPTQVEPTVPAGSGDADFDAALAAASAEPAAEPPAAGEPEPAVAEPAAADPDFTFATLENGQREMRLATGQVYRGKDDAELYGQLAKAQVAASRRITELSRAPEPAAPLPRLPPLLPPSTPQLWRLPISWLRRSASRMAQNWWPHLPNSRKPRKHSRNSWRLSKPTLRRRTSSAPFLSSRSRRPTPIRSTNSCKQISFPSMQRQQRWLITRSRQRGR
jgi:hypothetical protein